MEKKADTSGFYNGRHYTTYVEDVKALKLTIPIIVAAARPHLVARAVRMKPLFVVRTAWSTGVVPQGDNNVIHVP